MQKFARATLVTLASAATAIGVFSPAARTAAREVLTGQGAFSSYLTESPGVIRKITVADLPKPFATPSAGNGPTVVSRPKDAWPKVPDGFKIDLYASDLDEPREIRKAPNGDLFVAASDSHKVLVFRGLTRDGKPQQTSTFATGFHQPFGIAFYPLGDNPQWIYIANTNSVVRYA